MADYGCFPLWSWDYPEFNVDPASLPLSATLIADLYQWQDRYDAILNWDDPASSGFPTPEAETAFRTNGARLARRLQTELGPGFQVRFQP
ncbi:hypothetical protein CMUST_03355 [Corynebacterium mustelae]|uniref:Uncharacterized protein n=2 Tax=Corynebacterium mustelae TaxID=571915 RepID=A0A0G3GWT9_9CORY|nr:hypothetical protein CMUST_03355 [Corynebacterium mustelae]